MRSAPRLVLACFILVGCCTHAGAVQAGIEAADILALRKPTQAQLLGPPDDDGPVVVQTRFDL